MGVKHFVVPVIGASIVMVLTGCSSTKSSAAAAGQAAPSSPVSVTSPSSAATTPSAAASTPTSAPTSPTLPLISPTSAASTAGGTSGAPATTGHTISDLLGTGGEITTATMPTAKPEWIARVQPLMAGGAKIDAKSLNLVALVDEAAREHDVFGLVRLSNGQMTQDTLSRPGVLDNLVALLEKTHPEATDGFSYPGFTLDGGAATPVNAADLKALGATSAAAYKGVTTYFRTGGGAPTDWTGIVVRG